MTDLADHAAATAAGYQRIQYDRGAGKSPRYVSRYEKPTIGATGAAGGLTTAEGHSASSQAAADTAALASLNGARGHRYGKGASANQDAKGGTLSFDVN
jgi:outer membrane usher protein FimD/PapC